jgi:hypothetical protein
MDKDGWHHAAILGQTKASKLFPALLQDWDVLVLLQLNNNNELTGMLDRLESETLANRVQHYSLL